MQNVTEQLHVNTPLLESHKIRIRGTRVWLKLEALQPAGSFKNRGIGIACQHYVAQGAKRLVSSSGGNAGIATSYAGFRLGVPVNVIVPENAPQTAIDAMREFDADVEVHGATWQEAHDKALSMVDDHSVLIHPFDDPLLWPGHSTLIDEIVAEGLRPDAVVLSVGGGGLLCGVAEGLKRHGLNNTTIVAVETEGAASLAAAMSAGKPVQLDDIKTIANTLGAKQVCDQAFHVSQQHPVASHVIHDSQALNGCLRFLDDHRILVEPACGAALSAVYEPTELINSAKDVLVVVCGGMGVSLNQLQNWQRSVS